MADPGPGEIKLTQTACGLNFIDVYLRTGLYPLDDFPEIIGMEGAGIVSAVGAANCFMASPTGAAVTAADFSK